jgi:uncharacterized membrane protein
VCVAALACLVPDLSAAAPAGIAQQSYLKASNTGTNDFLGWSVAVFGDTLVIGAYQESSNSTGVNGNQTSDSAANSGAAYVFVRTGATWTQQAYLKASNTGTGDNFGRSVAIAGDTVVIGATGESSSAAGVNGNQSDNGLPNSGAAYVFVRTGTNWSQQAYLKASNPGGGDRFGWSVAVAGDTVVVGAFRESSGATGINGDQTDDSANGAGAAYVFVRAGTNWSQQAYLKASNTDAADQFGNSVAISGETILVGANGESSSSTGVNGNQNDNSAGVAGAAYVFVREGTNWSQQAYLKASNAGPGDFFGYSLALDGDTAVVGAWREESSATGVNGDQSDNNSPQSGAAYIFVRSGTNWVQQAYLKASNTEASDNFGWAVAVSGNTVVVGAPFEDSSATGVNGASNEMPADDSGAGYVFVRNGTNWSPQAYLKASNTETADNFGSSVAVAGDTVFVGSPREDSHAIGVNGDESDNSVVNSGAAYVFVSQEPGPRLALLPDGTSGYFVRVRGLSGETHRLQRAPDVTGPWDTLSSLSVPPSGSVEYHDAAPPLGQAFYRTIKP